MGKLNLDKLHKRAVESRLDYGLDSAAPIDIFDVVLSKGDLTLVFDTFSENISGMCINDSGNKIIKVNSSLSEGRQRYTVAHELYHLNYHADQQFMICVYPSDQKRFEEKEADAFASFFIMPNEALSKFLRHSLNKNSGPYTIEDLILTEQYFKISHIALLWRMVNGDYITSDDAECFRSVKIIQRTREMGLDISLYKPTNIHTTMGSYIKKVEDLNKKGLISTSLYENYLLDAFRNDIVLGEIQNGEID